MERCLLAMGGNQGIGPDTFQRAADQLAAEGVHVQSLASVFRTKAVGENAGADFLNTAAIAVTELAPRAILQALHRVEASFDRARTIHWGPRTLDLDLLICGSFVCDTPELVVPHPSMWYRRFVLDPLVEIAADEIHPVFKESIRSLWGRLQVRPLLLELQYSGMTGVKSGSRRIAEGLKDRLMSLYSAETVQFELARPPGQVAGNAFGQISLFSPDKTSEPDKTLSSRPLSRSQPALCRQRVIQVLAGDSFGVAIAEIRQIVAAITG